jgi:hypothetical protein
MLVPRAKTNMGFPGAAAADKCLVDRKTKSIRDFLRMIKIDGIDDDGDSQGLVMPG